MTKIEEIEITLNTVEEIMRCGLAVAKQGYLDNLDKNNNAQMYYAGSKAAHADNLDTLKLLKRELENAKKI